MNRRVWLLLFLGLAAPLRIGAGEPARRQLPRPVVWDRVVVGLRFPDLANRKTADRTRS